MKKEKGQQQNGQNPINIGLRSSCGLGRPIFGEPNIAPPRANPPVVDRLPPEEPSAFEGPHHTAPGGPFCRRPSIYYNDINIHKLIDD